jgi:hypothetical protein
MAISVGFQRFERSFDIYRHVVKKKFIHFAIFFGARLRDAGSRIIVQKAGRPARRICCVTLSQSSSRSSECGMRLRFAVAADVSSAPSKIHPQNNEPTHAGCHRSFGLAGARLVPSRSTSADTSRPAIPNVNHLPRAASWDNSRSKRPSPHSKAPEGWRTPRRFAFAGAVPNFRQVLDCGSPPPLFSQPSIPN